MKKSYFGKANGSFGELIQGCLECNTEFLVTLPIQKYSTVEFEKVETLNHVNVYPKNKTKACNAISILENLYGISIGGNLVINCEIEEGKGLSSSSADIVATIRAIAVAYNLNLEPNRVDYILSLIEPSDGVAYSDIVLYANQECKLLQKISSVPELIILSYDEGGTINTESSCQNGRSFDKYYKSFYNTLLSDMIEALQSNNLYDMGQISTMSAKVWQYFLYKSSLKSIVKLSEDINALGIVNTHSGTCIGILLDPKKGFIKEQIALAKKRIPNLVEYRTLNSN